MTKKTLRLIIGLCVLFALLFIFGITTFIANTKNHDWSHGLAPQKSPQELEKVKRAVDSVKHDAIIDTDVSNSNTTGHPFGHSIRITVLLEDAMVKATDDEIIVPLAEEVTRAVQKAGLKDTYDLYIVLDGNGVAGVQPSNPEYTAPTAAFPVGVDYVHDVSFKVE